MKKILTGKNRWLSALLLLLVCTGAKAQAIADGDDYKYERSSLYAIMVKHDKNEYADEMQQVFSSTPQSKRFYDHSLNVSTICFNPKKDNNNQQKNLEKFIEQEQLAKRLVSKWFGFSRREGCFNINMIKERGLYNASQLDMELADRSVRGSTLLEDAGENLINDTYVVFHDIKHINQSGAWNVAKWVGVGLLAVASAGAMAYGGAFDTSKLTSSQITQNVQNLTDITSGLVQAGSALNIKVFRVKVTSYLYRLKWNDEISGTFFSEYYTDEDERDPMKVEAYLADTDLFKLEYVGQASYTSTKTSTTGCKTNEDLIRKACTRAYDQAVADLQHKYQEFRIKAPLTSTEPLQAPVGLKEDINEKSRYEVLERIETKDGRIKYHQVGIIKPEKGKIWDNRFMAAEENAKNANLGYTTFKKVSGGKFYPGMLIREIK